MPPFREDLVQLLLEHRSVPASAVLQTFNFLGDLEGYVLVVSFVYATWDKRLALRLALIAIGAMVLNHALKTLIANPRPFVGEGTWAEKWAVPAEKARTLVSEYSTPSGHAMTGSAFYAYLAASLRRRWLTVAAVTCIALTGLARPYIGVHYVEDVLLGWAVGIPLAVLALRYGEGLGDWWRKRSGRQQLGLVLAACGVLWLGTRAAYATSPHGPPLAVLSYLGFLTGIVLSYPVEAKRVAFDPRSSGVPTRLLRFVITVGLVAGTLVLLDPLFALVGSDDSILGDPLRYLRYAAAGAAGMLVGPYLFVRVGMASAIPTREDEPSSPRQ
ncbi:MAG: phosphatase PAP2 family protein [Myxococcota bacterium]